MGYVFVIIAGVTVIIMGVPASTICSLLGCLFGCMPYEFIIGHIWGYESRGVGGTSAGSRNISCSSPGAF